MNKRQLTRVVVSAGIIGAIALTTSHLLGGRVVEVVELVSTRQGLNGIGEAATQDMYRSMLAIKNVSFATGLTLGSLGAFSIATLIGFFGAKTIYIQAGNPQDLERLRAALRDSHSSETTFPTRVQHGNWKE